MSYTKAVLDYKLATQHEDKIKYSGAILHRVKIYIPSPDLCQRISAVEIGPTVGECTTAIARLNEIVKDFESRGGPILVVKTVNNRYKLGGVYCVRTEFHFPDDNLKLKFPVDPDTITSCGGSAKNMLDEYMEVLSAYEASKKYVEKLKARVIILRDD